MKPNAFIQILKIAFFTGALVMCGCAADPHPNMTTLSPVGPKPPGIHSADPIEGYLKVYSSTDEHNDGDVMYYPHSSYTVYSNNGERFKTVENHFSLSDETPETVSLPVGNYYVMAHSELDGMVRVPVIIKGGQTTVVNLERGRMSDKDAHEADPSRGVSLPSGQVAGWRAS